jgi:hypothetical protein
MAKTKAILATDDFDMKPTLHVSEKQLPEIKNWKIDGEYTLEVKVRMTGIHKSQYSDNPKTSADFTIEQIKCDDDDSPLRKGMDSFKPSQVRVKAPFPRR